MQEIVSSRFGGPRRVAEPNQVRERVIAEAARHLLTVASHAIRAVQQLRVVDHAIAIATELAPRGLPEDLFVGGPSIENRRQLRAGTMASDTDPSDGQTPAGRASEQSFVQLHRSHQLL
jgi:hypothetical protein